MLKDQVITEVNAFLEHVRAENPDVTFAPFPIFASEYTSYIYNSLAWMFVHQQQLVSETIATLLGNISQLKTVPRAYDGYMQLCRIAEKADLKMEALYLEQNPNMKREATCKKGCSWCCFQSIQLNGLEAKMLWKKLEGSKRLQKQEDAFLKLRSRGAFRQKEYVAALGMLDSRCPFLTNTNECSIYQQRPLVCRYYVSYEDPKKCYPENPADTIVQRLPVFTIILETAMFEMFGVATLQAPNDIRFFDFKKGSS